MILRPLIAEDQHVAQVAQVEPAWCVVARTQSIEAKQYLLIAQPDHARLSGELSALFRAPFLPPIDEGISRAIAVHDDGWARIPFERDLRGDPPRTNTGRPQHFMQVTVEESLAAWTGSIQAAGEVSRLGEFMVSTHFSRIGRTRVQMQVDTPEDTRRLHSFLRGEEEWQAKHQSEIRLTKEQVSGYVDLLQFCDLLSLYLSCGSTQAVEFPQSFRGHQIQVRYESGVYVTSPSLFASSPQRFYLPARIYPTAAGEEHTQIAFQLK